MLPKAREGKTGIWSRVVKRTRCEKGEDDGRGNGRKEMSNKRKRVSNGTRLCKAKKQIYAGGDNIGQITFQSQLPITVILLDIDIVSIDPGGCT